MMASVQNVTPPVANPQSRAGILQQGLSDRMADVLRRALSATGGTGAAIALIQKGVMRTCARAGCAPDLGSQVNIDGSFAGLCVRTGQTLRSGHLQGDLRANEAAGRALNVSSMLVTPVRNGDVVVGVLAVFDQKPDAFLPSHLTALEVVALVLNTTPPPKPMPANHEPRPLEVPRTAQWESPVHHAAPPPKQAQARETKLLSVPAAEPPARPRQPVRPAEASSALSKVAPAAAKPAPVAPSLPPAAAATRNLGTTTKVERTPKKESAVQPRPLAHKASQAPETAPAFWPYAKAPAKSSPVRPSVASAAAATKKVETTRILRFHKSERMLHWSIAIPFLVCFSTAVILVVFYNLYPHRPYRAVFSLLHRISGACLMVFPVLTALRYWSDHGIHLYNIKEAFTWVRDDVKWLMLMGAAALSSKVVLPEQGKFNAAEKLNFLMVLCTYPLFIATGVVLWRLHLPIAAWIIHVGMAAMATPLVLGHIFMATINPETRVGLSGMLTGYVDRHWARHHYTRWYRQLFEDGHAPCKPHAEKQPRRQSALVQCPSEAE